MSRTQERESRLAALLHIRQVEEEGEDALPAREVKLRLPSVVMRLPAARAGEEAGERERDREERVRR